jgi:hypothetical protein
MRHYKLYGDLYRPGVFPEQDPLFRVLFNDAPDAVFILQPGNFTVIDCNDKALQLFQVADKSALTGKESFALYDSEPVEFSKNTFIDTINRGMDYSQEMAFRSLKGNVFWGQCSLRKVETPQGPVILFRVRRVVDYMKTAEMMSVLIKQTARVTGLDFFRLLTELLVKSFGVSLAFIARIDPELNRANVLYCWHKKQITDCQSFDLAENPSGNVMRGYTAYYPNNLQEMFPNDLMIRQLGMDSFMGTPVFDVNGEVSGLLVMMDDKPMEEIPNSRYMLSIFASRIGAELERMKIEEAYRKKIEELEAALKNQSLMSQHI